MDIHLESVSMVLINCQQSVCNKSDEISHVIKDMDLDVVVVVFFHYRLS